MIRLAPLLTAVLIATTAAAFAQTPSDDKAKRPLTSPPSAESLKAEGKKNNDNAKAPAQPDRQQQSQGPNASRGVQKDKPPPSQAQQDRPQPGAHASLTLNQEQQTQVSAALGTQVSSLKVRPLTEVNFSLQVGTVVPGAVPLYPLQAEVVEIAPQFRGFSFFLANNQIVIVEPDKKEIVTILPYQDSATTKSVRQQLTPEQRTTIGNQAKEPKSVQRREDRARTYDRSGTSDRSRDDEEADDRPSANIESDEPRERIIVIGPRGRRVIELID